MAWPAYAVSKEGGDSDESPATLKEVVVTATKTEEKRKDIPNSVVVLDAMDIQESAATSVGELLANELGIDLRTFGNYGGASQEIHIRGMSGNATQVFVNGVNVNSPSLGSADVAKIPLNNIDRIEVVKGSGSLLYGTGAMGGTINIITKRPERGKINVGAGAGYGNEDTYELSAEQGMFLFGDLGYYLTASLKDTDGFRSNSDLEHKDVSLNLVLDKGDALNISLYGDYIDREYGLPGVEPPERTQDFFVNGIKVMDEESENLLSKGSDEDSHVVLDIKNRPVDWLDLRLKTDYTDMEGYNYFRYVGYMGDLPGSKTWTNNDVYGAEGNVTITALDHASLLLGAEYKDYDWESKGIELDGNGMEDPTAESTAKEDLHTTGLFSEAQYRPCRYFKALVGIRHEDHSEFGTENVPRYGLIFNPLEDTVLKVNHGRHFRAPTPNDLFWPDDGFTRGNPNLEPEKGWHSDVSVEQSLFDDNLFIALSYFNWDVDHKIQWGPDSTGVWTPENLRTYEADGLEAGTRIGPFYDITLKLDYTYLDAQEENKAYTRQDYGFPPDFPPDFQYTWMTRRAAYTPENQFKGSVVYGNESGLTASATFRYTGDRVWYHTETTAYPDTTTVKYTLDSYWTADVKLEQRLLDHMLVSLQANNLFDEEYDTYYGIFTDPNTFASTVAGYPAAGRFVFAKITYEY